MCLLAGHVAAAHRAALRRARSDAPCLRSSSPSVFICVHWQAELRLWLKLFMRSTNGRARNRPFVIRHWKFLGHSDLEMSHYRGMVGRVTPCAPGARCFGARVCDPQQRTVFKSPQIVPCAFWLATLLRLTEPRSAAHAVTRPACVPLPHLCLSVFIGRPSFGCG